jgi:hypothetical protein
LKIATKQQTPTEDHNNFRMGRIRDRDAKSKEKLFTSALRDIETGKERSIRAAAERYGLSYETLRDRKRGARSRLASHEDQQCLTAQEELAIKRWILKIDSYGWPPKIDYVRHMALEFIRSHGNPSPKLGKNWITRYLDRHPDLASRFTNRLDKQRAFASNPLLLRDFFKKVTGLHYICKTFN